MRSEAESDVRFIQIRDPVARYVSAYHSKIKCCDDAGVTPCYQDTRDQVPHWVLLQNRNKAQLQWEESPVHCFTADEYLYQLERAHELGIQYNLDPHVRPQHFSCAEHSCVPTLVGNATSSLRTIASLRGSFDFQKVDTDLHTNKNTVSAEHREDEFSTPERRKRLCLLASAEYAWYADSFSVPSVCQHAVHGGVYPKRAQSNNCGRLLGILRQG